MRQTTRGNILFLILLAAVLFAALAYALANSMRGGGKDGGPEKAKLIASEILQYASLLENTIMRLQLVNGCRDTEISFDAPQRSGYAFTTRNECKVFHPDGGNVPLAQRPEWLVSKSVVLAVQPSWDGYYDSNLWSGYFTGLNNYAGTASDAADLAFLVIGLKPEVCAEINRLLFNNPIFGAGTSVGNFWARFAGGYAEPANTDQPKWQNGLQGCPNANAATFYNYGKVLISR